MKHNRRKFPKWFFYKIKFQIDFRHRFWKDGCVIWLGTEFYRYYKNGYVLDITIINVGLKIHIISNNLLNYGIK
jgi:hypothetical protein